MGPLAGIGDVVSQSICYPILAGVCIQLALAGNFAGPILFEIIYKVLMLTLGYNMYMLGYKRGKAAIIDLLQTGLLNRILEAVSFVGLMVVGSMAVGNVKWICRSFKFTFTNDLGGGRIQPAIGVFDSLLPGLLPIGVVLGVWGLLRKRVKTMTVIVICFCVALVLVGIKALKGCVLIPFVTSEACAGESPRGISHCRRGRGIRVWRYEAIKNPHFSVYHVR
jgi:PTS system mannose-specific IID component